MDAGLAYLHFIAILTLTSLLVVELILLKPALIAQTGRWLGRVDAAYGAAAGVVVASGLLRAIYGAKGWDYYAHYPVFHAKLTLFIVIALISIWPTRMFIRWGRNLRRDAAYIIPFAELKRARRLVMIQLHLLVLLPLFGVLMARGYFLRLH